MTTRTVMERIGRWREQLHRSHLDTGQRPRLHAEVDALARRQAQGSVADLALLEGEWLALETRLEAEHPLLARLVQESLRKLADMGI